MGQFPCVCDNAMFLNCFSLITALMPVGQIFCILPILGCWIFHINFLDRFLEKKKSLALCFSVYIFQVSWGKKYPLGILIGTPFNFRLIWGILITLCY